MPFGTIDNALFLVRTPALVDRTYGFLTQMPQTYAGLPLTGYFDFNVPFVFQPGDFSPLTQGEMNFVRFFMNYYLEDYITFGATEAMDPNITFGVLNVDLRTQNPDTNAWNDVRGFAYYPQTSFEGDVWLVARARQFDEYATLAHEIGHALGLRHAHDPRSNLPGSEQNKQFSIMAYDAQLRGPAQVRELQLYDVAALQFLYGASATNQTDTSYSDFSRELGNRFYCLWDAGGIDEIDISTQASAGYIDLRPGFFSSLGIDTDVTHQNGQITDAGIGNVSLAFGTLIENATGSDRDDVIIGNVLDNVLNGGDGNDILYADGFELDGEEADYSLIFRGAVIARPSDPTLQMDELRGGADDDYLFGGRGLNFLDGGEGDDRVQGGRGDDDIVLGIGNDWFSGGAGINIFTFNAETSGLKTFSNIAFAINIISAMSDDAYLEMNFSFDQGNFYSINGRHHSNVVVQLVGDPYLPYNHFNFVGAVITNLTLRGLDGQGELIEISSGEFFIDTGGAEAGSIDALYVNTDQSLYVFQAGAHLEGFTGSGTTFSGSGSFRGGTGNDTYIVGSGLTVAGGGGSDVFYLQRDTSIFAGGISNNNTSGNQIFLEGQGELTSMNFVSSYQEGTTLFAGCVENLGNWIDLEIYIDDFGTPGCLMRFRNAVWEDGYPWPGEVHTTVFAFLDTWSAFGITAFSDYLNSLEPALEFGLSSYWPDSPVEMDALFSAGPLDSFARPGRFEHDDALTLPTQDQGWTLNDNGWDQDITPASHQDAWYQEMILTGPAEVYRDYLLA